MARRRRSFDRIAQGVVASVLGIVGGGCGGLDVEGMEAVPCNDGAFDALGDVELSAEYDSVELVQQAALGDGATSVIASRGTRCSGAADAEACRAAAEALLAPYDGEGDPPPSPFLFGDCGDVCDLYFLVTTRGDEVTAIGAEGVHGLFLPIDTPTEAAWIAGLARYQLTCGNAEVTGVRAAGEGWEMTARYRELCLIELRQELIAISTDGTLKVLDEEVISSEDACVGRRPACASAIHRRGATLLGARLAGLAQLEAESVPAFAELGRELSAHGAPRSLVRRAHRARRDEVRHAQVMGRLARRHGGRPSRSSVPRAAPRPLVDVAILNAREGCVREAFGAVVGRWQAHRAGDPAIRAAMVRIARDEAAHAGLSLAIDAWATRHLDAADRARVDVARVEALATLRAEITRGERDPEVAAALGLPAPVEARLLLQAFARFTA